MNATGTTAQLLPFAKDSYLSGLHFLRPSTEGHIGVAGARAIPLFLLDIGDEGAPLAGFPLTAPIVENLLDQFIILLQQQFSLLETDQLQSNTEGPCQYNGQSHSKFKQHSRVTCMMKISTTLGERPSFKPKNTHQNKAF